MVKKTYLYNICIQNKYSYKVYQSIDGIGQTYYVAHPVDHGGSVLADNEEDIRPQLEKQAPILDDFLSKVDKGFSK